MDERIWQLRVGFMVLGIFLVAAILLFTFGRQESSIFELFASKQVFHVQFREAPEVTPDTPALKSGIRIGRVTRVRLADEVTESEHALDPDTGAVVTLEIDADRKVFSDEVCRIKRNLLGDAVLEFVRAEAADVPTAPPAPKAPDSEGPEGAAAKARRRLESGAWIRGTVQADPIQVVGNLQEGLVDAITSVEQTSDEIRVFFHKVSGFMGPEEELAEKQKNLKEIIAQAKASMKEMYQLAQSANDVIGDPEVRADIKEAVGQFPGVVRDARGTLNQMSHTFKSIDETVRGVNESLVNIQSFAQRLDEQGGSMIERLDRSSETLELLMGELLTLTTTLNTQEGTLGRLVRDPELYDNLNETVTNLKDLSRRMRPVIDNATILSDKLARHPELLGVSGALQRSSGTKGVPRLSPLRGASRTSLPPSYPHSARPPPSSRVTR